MSASRELQRQLRRIEPCLPRAAKQPPAGPGWIHEIKHDGYRIMAVWDHGSVRLYSRRRYDFAEPFPLAAAAIRKLPVRSCLIDGEAIVCNANGLAVFDLLRLWGGNDVVLCAFDLLELDGEDLRRCPIEERKATLANLLRKLLVGGKGRPAADPVGRPAFVGTKKATAALVTRTGRPSPSTPPPRPAVSPSI